MADETGKRVADSTPKGVHAENDIDRRHDDLLWKDLLARFFVPMYTAPIK